MAATVKRVCLRCNEEFDASCFDVKRGYGNYCSRLCAARDQWAGCQDEMVCETCGESILVANSKIKNGAKYCSPECYRMARMSTTEMVPCEVCGKEIRVTRSKKRRGVGRFCSRKCFGIGKSGPNATNWKGGKTPEKVLIRCRRDYAEWREMVFARDDWACQDCGVRSNKQNHLVINAHHVFSFAEFPEHRLAVWNGVTLCLDCHKKIHFGEVG